MIEEIIFIYSPLCKGYENVHYIKQVQSQGKQVKEISVLDLDKRWDELKPWMQETIQQMRLNGGFIAGPLVFYREKAMPAWELSKLLEEGYTHDSNATS